MRSASVGDGASSAASQVDDRFRDLPRRRLHLHHRLHRPPFRARRSTNPLHTARDGTGSDVTGVSRGRQRDRVLPVRVQLHDNAVLGGRRRRSKG